MNNGQIRDLCIGLLHAETEDEVIELLKKVGYWEDSTLWRFYGDVENNWGQGGNQQSLAEAALVEKVVNSVDARLINECLERNYRSKTADAPKSTGEAVSRFFEGGTGKKISTGDFVEDWTDEKIREVAQGITLCGTGTKPILNLTISDCGEGQTPRKIPITILSLSRSNKMYIPFVQGQFNQGGTGALRFCASITCSWSSAAAIRSRSGRIRTRKIPGGALRSCAASGPLAAAATRSTHTWHRSGSATPMRAARATRCRSRHRR